ncbi:MAG: hypothetical protein HUK21_00245 [Fibrobacteraceae bacterium]|nr:hypothetical protein [Fibrobacteraceae bacterium]
MFIKLKYYFYGMKLTKVHFLPQWALWFVLLVLFEGCSINLTKGIQNASSDFIFFKEFSINYGGKTLVPPKELVQEYSAIINPEQYHPDKCYGKASIYIDVQEKTTSAWYLGLVILPIWPILPVNEVLVYNMDAQIYCNNQVVHHLQLKEEEHIQATFYGPLRSDLVNKASSLMHQKLIRRMEYELQPHSTAEMNMAWSM